MKWAAIVFLVVLCRAASAEVPPQYVPILKAVYEGQQEREKMLEEKANKTERNLREFDPSIPNNQRNAVLRDRQKEIKSLRQQVELIKAGNAPDELPLVFPVNVGAIGRLPVAILKPSAISVDGNEVLAKCEYIPQGPATQTAHESQIKIIYLKPQHVRPGEAIEFPRAVKVKSFEEMPIVEEIDWNGAQQYYTEYLKSIRVIK
jgi:hypothetical protein